MVLQIRKVDFQILISISISWVNWPKSSTFQRISCFQRPRDLNHWKNSKESRKSSEWMTSKTSTLFSKKSNSAYKTRPISTLWQNSSKKSKKSSKLSGLPKINRYFFTNSAWTQWPQKNVLQHGRQAPVHHQLSSVNGHIRRRLDCEEELDVYQLWQDDWKVQWKIGTTCELGLSSGKEAFSSKSRCIWTGWSTRF